MGQNRLVTGTNSTKKVTLVLSCILPCIRLVGRRYLFGGEVLGIGLVLVIVLVLVHQFEHDSNK